jgi:hypothetical protein
MSVISIYVDGEEPIAKVVAVLRPITGASIRDIRTAVAASTPVYQRELFLNDHVEVADQLKRLLKTTQREGIDIWITEFEDEISEETLLGILAAADTFR